MEILLFIISFLFVFGLVVLIHELGHFLAAKTSGLNVEEFGFGYPPRAISKKIGETIYSINWIPFGGFVKILGEEGNEVANPRSLAAKSKLVKAKVMGAGIFMNLVLAIVIFSILYFVGFLPIVPGMDSHIGVSNHVYVEGVTEGTPAFNVGIKSQDEIVTFASEEVNNIDGFSDSVEKNVGKFTPIEVYRNGELESYTVIPYKEEVEGREISRIGISITQETRADNFLAALLAGFLETFRISWLTVQGIFQFFVNIFTQFKLSEGAVGPVGLAVITNEVRQLGFSYLMQFVAILSVSLALFNLMPIPALDGGHLFFLLYEKIRGKDINDKIKNRVTIIGFTFLIVLMLVITVQDLLQFNIIDSIKKIFGA